jgi:hypothetical protein
VRSETRFSISRAGVKRVLNAMIYASKPLGRFPNETRKFSRTSERLDYVVGPIAVHHAAISHLLFQGRGLRAMWIESSSTPTPGVNGEVGSLCLVLHSIVYR